MSNTPQKGYNSTDYYKFWQCFHIELVKYKLHADFQPPVIQSVCDAQKKTKKNGIANIQLNRCKCYTSKCPCWIANVKMHKDNPTSVRPIDSWWVICLWFGRVYVNIFLKLPMLFCTIVTYAQGITNWTHAKMYKTSIMKIHVIIMNLSIQQ